MSSVRAVVAKRPELRNEGWGDGWIALLNKNGVTATIAQQEPARLVEHLETLATIASCRGLLTPVVLAMLERVLAIAVPAMKAAGLSLDLARATRDPHWRPPYVDLPTALVLEMLLAHEVPLLLPTPMGDVCLPLVRLGLLPGDAPGKLQEHRALRRVLAEPVLCEAIVRMYEPAVNNWAGVHADLRELDVDVDLEPVFGGLAAFVQTIANRR